MCLRITPEMSSNLTFPEAELNGQEPLLPCRSLHAMSLSSGIYCDVWPHHLLAPLQASFLLNFSLCRRFLAFVIYADSFRSLAMRWVQVRLPEGQTGQGSGYIGFHWDKDEDLVDAAGISLHPQVSTVTYLCSDGAPTLICERRAPLDYGDLDELYSDDRAFSRAYLSYPFCVCAPGSEDAVVKHVSFDGQLLHSAPREFARDGASKGIRSRCPSPFPSCLLLPLSGPLLLFLAIPHRMSAPQPSPAPSTQLSQPWWHLNKLAALPMHFRAGSAHPWRNDS